MAGYSQGFDEDGVQDYLKEASNHRLLSRDEEVELFQRIEAGDDAAREEMVRCNLRFVIKIAMAFKGMGLPLGDLIQEGNIGLITVIEKFEWRRGFRFSTYAAYYIRQEIQAAIHRSGNMIRIPVRKSRLLSKINEVYARTMEKEGHEPSISDLSIELGEPCDKIESVMELRHFFSSMDAEISDDGLTISESIADESQINIVDEIHGEELSFQVRESLDYLTEREREVIELRFGMNDRDDDCLSLRQASKIIGLSQEGVRRVEHRALEKLRRPAIAQRLDGLMTA